VGFTTSLNSCLRQQKFSKTADSEKYLGTLSNPVSLVQTDVLVEPKSLLTVRLFSSKYIKMLLQPGPAGRARSVPRSFQLNLITALQQGGKKRGRVDGKEGAKRERGHVDTLDQLPAPNL